MARSNLLSGLLYEKTSWILQKILVHKSIHIYVLNVKIILYPLTSDSNLTVSNYQVCSDDECDLRPVYSGKRFRASWPS